MTQQHLHAQNVHHQELSVDLPRGMPTPENVAPATKMVPHPLPHPSTNCDKSPLHVFVLHTYLPRAPSRVFVSRPLLRRSYKLSSHLHNKCPQSFTGIVITKKWLCCPPHSRAAHQNAHQAPPALPPKHRNFSPVDLALPSLANCRVLLWPAPLSSHGKVTRVPTAAC